MLIGSGKGGSLGRDADVFISYQRDTADKARKLADALRRDNREVWLDLKLSSDAVAMSVLDPLEVLEIEVWPLPEFQEKDKRDETAKAHLNALEREVTRYAVENSKFKAILNEKDPPAGDLAVQRPKSLRGRIISDRVLELRSHLDFRIARRALIIARLAQVIAERKVQGGLRRVLLTQAKRLEWLSERRFEALGGASSVEKETDDET